MAPGCVPPQGVIGGLPLVAHPHISMASKGCIYLPRAAELTAGNGASTKPLENEALGTEGRRVLEAGAPSGPACSRSPATHPSAHTAPHCRDPGLYLYHVCGCTTSWLRQAEASLFSYGMQTPNDGAGGSSSVSRHRTQGPCTESPESYYWASSAVAFSR